jgi:death-on-curing protein
MEVFLALHGFEVRAPVDEQEQIVLQVASGELDRGTFTAWLKTHIIQRS